jgi:exodeoxyribonuclease-5
MAITYTKLNKKQKAACDEIVRYLTTDDIEYKSIVLLGYAGTGKTSTIGIAMERARKKRAGLKIALTAPTNKAVRVLRETSELKIKVAFKTIHKMLGLKPVLNGQTGQQNFTTDVMANQDIEQYNVVAVDESSMLDDTLFHNINNYPGIKKIFMGDPAQIPPVNKHNSIPMMPTMQEQYGMHVIQLDEIMRQGKNNPVIELSFFIRNNLKIEDPIYYHRKTKVNEDNIGVHFYSLNNQGDLPYFRDLVLKYFKSEEFKTNGNYCKVIAYRNQIVDTFNGNIRNALFGNNARKIMVGEKLIANKPIAEIDRILFNTNDEFSVISYDIKIDDYGLKFYACLVAYKIGSTNYREYVNIVHEDGEKAYKMRVAHLLNLAKQERDNPGLRKQLFAKYYQFKAWFADVKYNYAITAHKSQGSSYENVFVIEFDINVNSRTIERNRIKYTAFTRTKNNLFILQE